MTITVHVRRGAVGHAQTETFSEVWSGQTARYLAERYRRQNPEWEGVPLAVCVEGRHLTGRELELGLPDGVDVVITPAVEGLLLIVSLVSLALTLATTAYQLLAMQKPPNVPQQPDETASPTHGWEGVRTTTGQGGVVPIVYGEHDVGGQVIYTDVIAGNSGAGATGTVAVELLRVILALSEGRIDSIGGTTGGTLGEFGATGGHALSPNGFPPIPGNIRINGELLDVNNPKPGAVIWGRMGELDQSVLPSSTFRGVTTVLSVGEQLDDVGDEAIFTLDTTEQIATVSAIIVFPGGIYKLSSGGGISAYQAAGASGPGVDFQVEWRPEGSVSWNALLVNGSPQTVWTLGSVAQINAAAFTLVGDLPQSALAIGPIELRIKRLTPRGGQYVTSSATWRQTTYTLEHTFAYPRTALLALEIYANSKLSGGLPQFQARVRGKRVRVWDSTLGWSDYTWDVPAAPFNWHTYPPGNNPAWVLVDYLLSPWGLGNWLSESDLDLQSFREWACFCDQDPNPASPWGEAAFRFDGVFDRAKPAWENVRAICQAGRAAPILRGNKIAVRYSYRDAHSDALVTVPAKASTQLFSDANVADVTVSWRKRAFRPTVIEFQFNNAEKEYRPDTFPVEDDESTTAGNPNIVNPDRWRKETIQAFGIVRESQLQRDGIWMHRINRLARKEITFRTGPWALALEPGDRFTFQHNVLRPFDEDTLGLTIRTGGSGVTSVVVDRTLTPSGGTDELIIRAPDGTPQTRTILSIVGTTVTLSSAVDADPGAPCAFGVQDKVVEDYECISIDLTEDLEREVHGLEWNDDIYDPLTETSFASSNLIGQSSSYDPFTASAAVDASDIRAQPDLSTPDAHLIHWIKPSGYESRPCRVWIRPAGASTWIMAGETEQSSLVVKHLGAWADWEVAVTLADRFERFGMPDTADVASLTVGEFPPVAPPNVSHVQAVDDAQGRVVRWDALDTSDLAHYEVRRGGSDWWAAEVVYRGREPRFREDDPSPRSVTYHVCARSPSGLYSVTPTTLDADGWTPPGTFSAIDVDEIATAAGTADGVSVVSSAFELDSDRFEGSYTSPEQALGFDGRAWWGVSTIVDVETDDTVDDWSWELDSGEGLWRLVDGRPSSPGLPGIDWGGATVDGLDPWSIDELPDTLLVSGDLGEPGEQFQVLVESRYKVDGVWGAWGPHHNGRVYAGSIQVRWTLRREKLTTTVRVTEAHTMAQV